MKLLLLALSFFASSQVFAGELSKVVCRAYHPDVAITEGVVIQNFDDAPPIYSNLDIGGGLFLAARFDVNTKRTMLLRLLDKKNRNHVATVPYRLKDIDGTLFEFSHHFKIADRVILAACVEIKQ